MTARSVAPLLLAVAIASCGPRQSQILGAAARPAQTRGSSPLYQDEIANAGVATAEDAVRRLRPAFLFNRGATAFERREVYLDGVAIGGVEELRRVPAQDVREIRVLTAIEATTRYGFSQSGGAILVVTKAGPSTR